MFMFFLSFMRFWVEILFVQKTHEKLKSFEFKASQLWESKIRNETFYNPWGIRDLFCALNEH